MVGTSVSRVSKFKSWPGNHLLDKFFCDFPHFLQQNAGVILYIRQLLLPSISFQFIHYPVMWASD
jgi:hypothetical protein